MVRSVSYSRTPAATVPTTPPATAVVAITHGPTGRLRPPPSANTSTATGTVMAPMSSSDGKKFTFLVSSMTCSTTTYATTPATKMRTQEKRRIPRRPVQSR